MFTLPNLIKSRFFYQYNDQYDHTNNFKFVVLKFLRKYHLCLTAWKFMDINWAQNRCLKINKTRQVLPIDKLPIHQNNFRIRINKILFHMFIKITNTTSLILKQTNSSYYFLYFIERFQSRISVLNRLKWVHFSNSEFCIGIQDFSLSPHFIVVWNLFHRRSTVVWFANRGSSYCFCGKG